VPAAEPSVARGSAPLFWAQVAGNAGLLVALVPITRALGPAGRGTLAFITVTAIVSAAVARLGVTEATTVFAAQRPRERAVLLGNVLLAVSVAAVGAAVLVCGGLLLVPSLRPPGLGDAELALMGLGMLASALADAGYMFTLGCSRFRFHAAVTIVSAWSYAAVVAAFAVAGELTVARAALIWVLFQGVKAFVLLAAGARAEGLATPDRRLLAESVSFGARAWIGSLSTAFNERVDQILVALLASEAVLGIYATAVNAFEILLYLASAAATAILPLVARSGAEVRSARVLGAFRSVALVTVVGVAVAAALGPPLLPLVFGEAFEPSATPFLWLLPGAVGFAAMAIFSNALVASAAPARSSVGPLVSLVLGIVLDVLLIPELGAEGAAIAASAALVAGGSCALVLYRLHASFPLRSLLTVRREDAELLRALARPFTRRA
jgi:O-antigen/teichoic acid export membrane protein